MSVEIILIPIALKVGTMALVGAAGLVAARRLASDDSEQVICFETQFKDIALLQKALQDFDCPFVLDGEQVQSNHGQARLIFAPDEQGVFNAYLVGNASIEEAETFLYALHDQYKRLVQQQSYETLLRRANEQSMVLEREEVLEDNSVVLTFTVS